MVLTSGSTIVWDVKAEIQMAEGQYEAAVETLFQLLGITPHDPTILRKLAHIEQVLARWDQAIEYSRRVTLLPGATKKDWHILGTMYYRKARAEKDRGEHLKKQEALLNAVECFNSAFITNASSYDERKHNVIVCDTLARTFLHLKRFSEAEDTVRKGLELDPKNYMLLELQLELQEKAKY